MKETELFKALNNGALRLPDRKKAFSDIPWSKHPEFKGVELKHLLTAKDTDGKFSYHLVKIAPECSIKNHVHENQFETHEVVFGTGICVNDNKEIAYKSGIISIFPAGIPHEVRASDTGLQLLAKFFPALL